MVDAQCLAGSHSHDVHSHRLQYRRMPRSTRHAIPTQHVLQPTQPCRRRAACKASLTGSIRPIDASRKVAAARAAEGRRPDCLFQDPYADLLSGQVLAQQGQGESTSDAADHDAVSTSADASGMQQAMDIIATRYIDESLLNALAATSTNRINKGEDFRQVVLLGDGMDTRAFRLPLPPGTMVFIVAAPEVHEHAEALLQTAGARTMRGCLLRRVNANFGAASGSNATGAGVFAAELQKAGFQGDRLSVWAVQGLHAFGMSRAELQEVFAEVTNSAAFHSLLVGELSGLNRKDTDNFLAEFGLLGACNAHGVEGGTSEYRRWDSASGDCSDLPAEQQRWLFSAQQMRLSLEQMGIYEAHVAAAEEADEDFPGGNFS